MHISHDMIVYYIHFISYRVALRTILEGVVCGAVKLSCILRELEVIGFAFEK